MISYLTLNIVYNGKFLFILVMAILVAFIIAMDTHLYMALQASTLIDQKGNNDGFFSPFKPLTMKLLMTDPINHYILTPSAEYFDEITKFSSVFYFITPNMISFTHVAISFISGKLVSSESLSTRRCGVVLYQFRSWLDDLDGVVYRSHSKTRGQYQSNKNTLGYYVDIYSDLVGGFALSFGVLFYLWKCPPNSSVAYSALPLTVSEKNVGSPDRPAASPTRKLFFWNWNVFQNGERPGGGYSKKYLFFKVLCFGALMAIAAITWDHVVETCSAVFQTDLHDTALKQIQTEALHSGSTWLIIYLWRIWEGQALLHMILLAIFLDKIWEFLNFVQYLGYIIIIVLNVISEIHIRKVRSELGL